jgi:hypothetical protein
MSDRRVLLYFAWSRPGETSAPLAVIDDRFPAVFELRRLFYPKFESLSGRDDVDQGIEGFLDHIQRPNFAAFAEQAETLTGNPVIQVERVSDDGVKAPLDDALIANADTIVVISFDSFRTGQMAAETEVEAIRRFLDGPDHLIFVCPHHDIGETADAARQEREDRQIAEHVHHGYPGIPPRQGFGGFARTLLASVCLSKTALACVQLQQPMGLRRRSRLSVRSTCSACSEASRLSIFTRICRSSNVSVHQRSGWRYSPGRQ